MKTNQQGEKKMKTKYLIKLNGKIVSRRNTTREYNYAWLRVVQRQSTIYFYKNTGETITVENCLDKNYPKTIVLNGQQVNQLTEFNDNEKDSLCYNDFINHIDESKTVTHKLNDTFVFNECSKYFPTDRENWEQKNLLFSKIEKFSDAIDNVRTINFDSNFQLA